MSTRKIIEAFDQWRDARQPMALVSVYETLGSTYTKAGHRIVIADDGSYCGLISGGCLEGDLAEHAVRVLESRSTKPLTYDMRDDVDDVFGLGVGCNGLIRVFMQPLLPEDGYQPFAALRDLYDAPHSSLSATVIETADEGMPPGTTFVSHDDDGQWRSLSASADAGAFTALLGDLQKERRPNSADARLLRIGGHGVLLAPIYPIPRLLILGAGLDSVPLVRMAIELGWYVDIVDHRPAYLERDDLAAADSVQLADPRAAQKVIRAAPKYDAAVVMSHHLETDAAWLRALAGLDLPYLGVLGPPARRERLLERLEADHPDLRRRLHGPIGLDIGGGGPEAIALSILAQLQSVFSSTA